MPTPKQIKFAESIAARRSEPLPPGVLTDLLKCNEYLGKFGTKRSEPDNEAAISDASGTTPPSAHQLSFLDRITKKLKAEVDQNEVDFARNDAGKCSSFISKYKPALERKIAWEELQKKKEEHDKFWADVNRLDFAPPALRKFILEGKDVKQSAKLVREFAKGGFSGLDVRCLRTPQEKLIGYWLEGLQSTAFEGLGELPNLLGKDETFPFEVIRQLLTSTALESLKFDQNFPPVRHLVCKLVDVSKKEKKKAPIVLSVLPLMAIKDPAAGPLGYRWVSAPEKVPLFNRSLMGESARKPGLALDHVDRFDEWALKQGEGAQDQPTATAMLEHALILWDAAFDTLAEPGYGGVFGYIQCFHKNKSKTWQIKNFAPVFSLVDGSAATGASLHVCNAYKQVIAEPDLLEDSRLALFKRVADVRTTKARRYDIEQGAKRTDDLTRYFGHMDAWKEDQREAFALDPAQRAALIALQMTETGELLAVNGPPGTGKTSLLRGVIASMWLAPLLSKAQNPACPLILACAATNQAVTNVIGSFDETPGPSLFDEAGSFSDGQLVGVDSRWLPHLVSYGWYVPSSIDDKAETDFAQYQMLGRKGPSDPWMFHGASAQFADVDSSMAESAYLRCAEGYLRKPSDVASVTEVLHNKILHGAASILTLQGQLVTWFKEIDMLRSLEPWSRAHQERRNDLLAESERLSGNMGVKVRLQADMRAVNDRLVVLARFNDFNATTERIQAVLASLPPADPLHTATDFFALKREDEELRLFAEALDKELRISFIQRIKQAFSVVLQPAQLERSQAEMRQLMARFGLPAGTGSPDFDAWHASAIKRLAALSATLDQTAAEGLRLYLRRQDVHLSPTAGYRTVWPAELEACRERLRAQSTQLVIQVQQANDALEPILAELASLAGVFKAHMAACERVRSLRNHIAATLEVFGIAAVNTQPVLECMDCAYETAAAGTQTPQGLAEHVSALNRQAQDWLDKYVRTHLFHLSARYWEGRYVLGRKELAQRRRTDETYVASSEEQLRLLATLAPVFVVTAYSAPKLMRRNMRGLAEDQPPYLFGEADLLIVDEAGQGTPDIGASAFLFAQRAIVVGDTGQLEPIWNVDEASDKALVQRFGLAQCLTEHADGSYAAVHPSGVLLARGSVMRMAQRASHWTDGAFTEAPGLTLTNHYRCLTPIIEICNRMVYGGALRVATRPPKILWRPELGRLGFLVTDPVDDTKRAGGSRQNLPEAKCIARWVRENEASIVAHYSRKQPVALEDVLAIITPYSGQKAVLKKALACEYQIPYDEHDKTQLYNRLTIDTVHTLQGAEKQIVIFSMVETGDPSMPQFYDKKPDLINVAVSRAKEMFITAMTQKAVDYARPLDPQKLGKPSDFLWQAAVSNGTRLNGRRLVIIESSNKCDLVKKALGGSIELEVLATEGHIAELDKPENWDALTAAAPSWSPVSAAGEKLFSYVKTLWPDLQSCHLATDPDAEGEAIAWHFLRILQSRMAAGGLTEVSGGSPNIWRMRFYKLEPGAIREAYDGAGKGLDAGMVKSALARALLDHTITTAYAERLGLGPANQFARGIGRVQLGALDLVAKASSLPPAYGVAVTATLANGYVLRSYVVDPKKNQVWTNGHAKACEAAIKLRTHLKQPHRLEVSWTGEPLRQLPPYPGLNTARLLALAWRASKLAPKTAMDTLQFLYEGHADTLADAAVPVSQPESILATTGIPE